jgi:hypothetical protein
LIALLALLLFAPGFAILGWVYWRFPASHEVTPARRRLDVAALALAVVASAMAMVWGFDHPRGGAGPLWPHVLSTLLGYHVFLAVLLAAFLVRRHRFRVA